MSEPPEPESFTAQWVERAEHDLTNAEHTLELEDDCPFDTVAFHAQQCAEKYLKAWLVENDVDFARTHDLVILVGLAREAGLTEIDASEIAPLNRYAVESRFPGEWDPITLEDATEAVEIARRVRASIREALSLPD